MQAISDNRIIFPSLPTFSVKDPMSALTHFAGCIAAIFLTPVMLIHSATLGHTLLDLVSLSIFMLSMIALYGASSAYHTFYLKGNAGLNLKRLDHMMIFILIAGTYTPICIMSLGRTGIYLLAAVWSLALLGMIFKLLWVTCPKWVSSVIYISMGWIVIFALPKLYASINHISFGFLLTGGIIYTIGGVIYALKLVKFNEEKNLWGSHEIFHLFVLGGSLCHFVCIYLL